MFEAGTIEEQALAHAFGSVEGGAGPLIPFLFVEAAGGMQVIRLVCDDSDRAFEIGRAQVRERWSRARAYCLVVEAFVRVKDVRKDAFIVETGHQGAAHATRHAQVFESTDKGARRIDAPVHVDNVVSAMAPTNPVELDWGPVTPDIYNEARGLAVHIVNHELRSKLQQDRTVRFLRARIAHHAPHLPEGVEQGVHVDDRGHPLSEADRAHLRSELERCAAFVRFTSEDGN
jgi:hypothetical protein